MQTNIALTLILTYLSYVKIIGCHKNNIKNDVTYLDLGTETHIKTDSRGLYIFCYSGHPKQIFYIWETISINVKISNDDFELYEGSSPLEVYKQYEDRRSFWSFNIFINKKNKFNLNPFNQSCIGVDAMQNFSVYLHCVRIDFWKLLYLVTGLILYNGAQKLSSNKFFYYSSGVTIGVCASFLVLIYIISKIIPKKPAMYSFVLGGWALFLYLIQILWENLQIILIRYKIYVAWYIVISGLISFFICYRMGPIENKKNQNIFKWSLQLAGLLAIAFHSDYQEAAIAFCCLVVLSKYFSEPMIKRSKTFWRIKFPPKPILLTSEEYYSQGVIETGKALQQLREHCNSPECKQWDTILKLKNAKRFAKFVEGASHLSDQEVLDYDSEEAICFNNKNDGFQKVKYRKNDRISYSDDESGDDNANISEDEWH